MVEIDSKYVVLKSGGKVVAKFERPNTTTIPDGINNHNSIEVVKISDKQTLANKTVDHSDLSDELINTLSEVYPV